jgi:SAM-dependent methyltransferase
MRSVLNVGGGSKAVPLPPEYRGWEHVLLDIDPRGGADIVCDARQLSKFSGAAYDSVYCSHNLEHYHHHDVAKVLAGFVHILKADGFAYIRVPDLRELMRTVVKRNIDIEDVLYQSPAGPITVRDVLYGFGKEIEQTGNDFYAHKTGFTPRSLDSALKKAGFPWVSIGVAAAAFKIRAVAFVAKPSEYARELFHLPEGR